VKRSVRDAIVTNMSEAQLATLETHDQRINENLSQMLRSARLLVSNIVHFRWAEIGKAFVAVATFLASTTSEVTRREQYIERSGRFSTQG
jgi:hypothetical protein